MVVRPCGRHGKAESRQRKAGESLAVAAFGFPLLSGLAVPLCTTPNLFLNRFLAVGLCLFAVGRVTAGELASSRAIEVVPQRATLNGPLSRLQMQVSGRSARGRRIDLTQAVRYEVLTPKVLSVTETGRVIPRASGTGRLRVRHGQAVVDVSVTVQPMTAAVRFRKDVMPILSKAGCNQGACHGSQYGKGGLKLSLLGYAPEQDYPELVRDWRGRRVSLIRPRDSLILKKPTMQIAHGGGQRFSAKSYPYRVLQSWIAAGAPPPSRQVLEVVDLKVTPTERVYRKGDRQQLRVVARYNDGSTRDVTATALYDSLADAVIQMDEGGLLHVIGQGQGAVMVRYEGQVQVSHALSPFAEQVDLSSFKPNNFVDEQVKQHWQRLGVKPAGLCSDEVFIRRAFLDAIGTLPKPDVVERFLASTDPRKREKLVDELLGLTGDPRRDIYVNTWSSYWALKWGDLLRNNRLTVGDGGMWAFSNWIRAALRDNMPIDRFVREIITAQGSIYNIGPANYYKIARRPADLAETTAQVFLGLRLQCARCHHHPFEVYRQQDYYQLAAFFTRVGTKSSSDFGALGGDTIVMVKRSGSIRHPRTRKIMQPTPLGGKPIDTKNIRDLRRPLADWLTSPENPYFARNIVNRIWAYFMGTGLVEPIDDMRASNPPSNPELLDALAADFVKNGFNLRKLMRAIMTSRVYQLTAIAPPESVKSTRLYLHYNVKRLPAEVLFDAIDFACGTHEAFRGVPKGTRAIDLPDPNYSSYFLDTLGRPKRVIACECERTSQPNLAQVLDIANGELVNRKLHDRAGRIATLLRTKVRDKEATRQLYLVTLSRPPTPREVAACRQIISQAKNRREGLEDVLWALINSREFLFNH